VADPRLRAPPFAVPAAPPAPGRALVAPPPAVAPPLAPPTPALAPLPLPALPPLSNKLKRLGATCLWVATKVAETSAPSCADVAAGANVPLFDRAQIVLAERALLRTLCFATLLPTAASFASAFLDAAASAGLVSEGAALRRAAATASYLCDLSLLPHACLAHARSALGAAAAAVALQRVGCAGWDATPLAALSGYDAAALAAPRALLLGVATDAATFAAAGLLPALCAKHGRGAIQEVALALAPLALLQQQQQPPQW
jgi:hypothetical protein